MCCDWMFEPDWLFELPVSFAGERELFWVDFGICWGPDVFCVESVFCETSLEGGP